MGKASRNKKLRKDVAVFEILAASEEGRTILRDNGRFFMGRAEPEIVKEKMVKPRTLMNRPDEFFVYDLANPKTDSALCSLLERLKRKFGQPKNVPGWLVNLVIDEPWVHASRGLPVSFNEVVALHLAFPSYPVSALETWKLVMQKKNEAMSNDETKL